MLIAIDGNDANVEKRVGVGVYAWNLLDYFRTKSSSDLQFIIYLKHIPRYDLPKQNKYFRYRFVFGPLLWTKLYLPVYLLFHKKADVFFTPAHYSPTLTFAPQVVTVHDLSFLYYSNEFLKKDLYKLTRWTKASVQRATKIIAVSNYTKNDLMKNYNVNPGRIKVIYNGYRPPVKYETSGQSILNRYRITDSKYVLYVGTLQPRKNVIRLIEAFKTLTNEFPGYKLVIVGKKGWMYDAIFSKVRELNLNDNVVFTRFIPDEEVSVLYKHAALFVLPSLHEGFGIPVLEAMSHGCPVAVANRSSLPEVGGDACVYFNPEDIVDMKNAMVKIINNQTLRYQLIRRGKERVKLFSFAECGKNTLDLLMKVANHDL